jgi:hypothetical protein
MMEIDMTKTEKQAAAAGKPELEVPTTTTPAIVPPVEIKPIQAKHLAAWLGMKPTALRRILRSMPEYADGVHTNYRWAENDPELNKIVARVNQLESDKIARAKAAKEALEARIALAAARETAAKIVLPTKPAILVNGETK